MKEQRIIDVHCHILSGIDDGAVDIEESVEMARLMYGQGIRGAVCTSHSGEYMDQYQDRLAALRDRLKLEGIELTIYPGCEVFCDRRDINHIVEMVEEGIYPRLGSSEYILLEFDPFEKSSVIVSSVEALRECGLKIVIAHIERCFSLHRDRRAVERLKELGCLFQINAYSLVKEHDEAIKEFAQGLVIRREADLLGSDGHRIKHRPPDVIDGVRFICENCDDEYMDRFCFSNAERLLNMDL